MIAAPAVHVVLPGRVEDLAAPSGGNTYDLRVCDGLSELGWRVDRILVAGRWPRHGDAASLADRLAELPDQAVVLLDGLVACGVPEVVVPEAGRLRLVVLVHLPLADETGLPQDLAVDLDARERRTLRAAHAVLVTSGWAARRLVEHHGLAAADVHVLAPGTDPVPVAAGTDGASGLLCVASVTPRKGHDLLVEALTRVRAETWTCTCVGPLDGAPDQVARLRDLIDKHRLAGQVHLVGPRSGGRLSAAYDAADLLVLPSRMETYGMVVTEALARGVPVVATSVGGVPEALGRAPNGEVPGILVAPDDPAALANALRRWLTDPRLRGRLRDAARRRRASLDSWTDTSARMAHVLANLPARGR